MNVNLELRNTIGTLDDEARLLLLQIAKKFTNYTSMAEDKDWYLMDDDWDEVYPDDLYYIELAEKELANGETISHNDRKWK